MYNQDPQDKVVFSSIIVQSRSDRSQTVEQAILDCEGATIATKQDHKFAVVLEAVSSQELVSKTEMIRSIDGVTGVELVAHFFEEEVDRGED